MHVAELWRFPVKSMGGEPLTQADIRSEGLVGDRVVHARNDRGLITARTHPGLLALHASYRATDGVALVEGHEWWEPDVADAVRTAAGPEARLAPSGQDERFDILPLLVATDGAIAAFGHDGRRLRPNLVLGGVDGLVEREWEGRLLVVGDAVILLHSLRQRCIVTTYDPDTLARDVEVLRDIRSRFGGELALNSAVLRPGTISVGDRAEVVEASAA